MKRSWILILFILVTVTVTFTQTIDIIGTELDTVGLDTLTITYNLDSPSPVGIILSASSDGGTTWVVPVVNSYGDLGYPIDAGDSLKIYWEPENETEEADIDGYQFRLMAADSGGIWIEDGAILRWAGCVWGTSPEDDFGVPITVGDVNGDGYDDICAGERYPDTIYIFIDGHCVRDTHTLDDIEIITRLEAYGAPSVGDENGDGIDDILIGKYLIHGSSSIPYNLDTTEAVAIFNGYSDYWHCGFGPDINGDGCDEIIMENNLYLGGSLVGEYDSTDAYLTFSEPIEFIPRREDVFANLWGSEREEFYCLVDETCYWPFRPAFHFFDDALAPGIYDTSDAVWKILPDTLWLGLGNGISFGDVDGNGRDDVMIGGYGFEFGGAGDWGGLLVFLSDRTGARTGISYVSDADYIASLGRHTGDITGDTLFYGTGMCSGDYNDDGFCDFVVSGTIVNYYRHPTLAIFCGRPLFPEYSVLLDADTLILFPNPIPCPDADFTYMKVGDFNGDGIDDLVTGEATPCHPPIPAPVGRLDVFWGVPSTFPFGTIYDEAITTYSSIEEKTPTPAVFAISAYPNPFNSSVRISAPEGAGIEIFDINGRRVAQLPSPSVPLPLNGRGRKSFLLPEEGEGGSESRMREVIWQPDPPLGSGVYLVRAKSFEKSITKPIIYIK